MKLRKLFWGFLIVLSMELAVLFAFAAEREVKTQDAVSVNEAVRLGGIVATCGVIKIRRDFLTSCWTFPETCCFEQRRG